MPNTAAQGASAPPSLATRLFDVRDTITKSDVGRQPGVKWSLSSHKPGNGVQDLLHPDISRLWQSDGIQPHFINIQFPKRTAITHVSIYLDHKLDDSYTPTKILIKGGTYFHDLVDIRYREFVEPSGWKTFMMVKTHPRVPEEAELEAYTIAGAQQSSIVTSPSTGHHLAAQPLVPIHAWLLQICILGNHLNGKDTHVRGVYIFGPPVEFPTFLVQQPHDLKPPGTLDDILFGQHHGDDDEDEDDLDAAGGRARTHVLPDFPSSSRRPAVATNTTSQPAARPGPPGLDALPPLSRNLTLGSTVR